MKKKKDKDKWENPSSPRQRGRWWGVLVVGLSIGGIAISIYLYYLHLSLMIGEVRETALCGSEGELGCHTLAASRYGRFLGLPLPIWGCFYFATLGILGLGGGLFRQEMRWVAYKWGFFLAIFGLVFDGYLGYIMFKKIQVVCPLCLSTYVINIVILLVLFFASRKRPEVVAPSLFSVFPRLRLVTAQQDGNYYENTLKFVLFGGALCFFLIVAGGHELTKRAISANDEDVLQKYQKGLLEQKPMEIKIAGRPTLGLAEADLTMVEFSDFRCPFCRRAAQYLKIVLADHKEDAKFVFKHFPLDKACNPKLGRSLHPGACRLAEGSVCADRQGKFWEFHDAAFESEGTVSDDLLNEMAKEIGLELEQFRECLDSGQGMEIVRQDIDEAQRLGLRQTPILFLNGRALRGVPRPSIFSQIVTFSLEELRSSESN